MANPKRLNELRLISLVRHPGASVETGSEPSINPIDAEKYLQWATVGDRRYDRCPGR
jgi:hypothetical protein